MTGKPSDFVSINALGIPLKFDENEKRLESFILSNTFSLEPSKNTLLFRFNFFIKSSRFSLSFPSP